MASRPHNLAYLALGILLTLLSAAGCSDTKDDSSTTLPTTATSIETNRAGGPASSSSSLSASYSIADAAGRARADYEDFDPSQNVSVWDPIDGGIINLVGGVGQKQTTLDGESATQRLDLMAYDIYSPPPPTGVSSARSYALAVKQTLRTEPGKVFSEKVLAYFVRSNSEVIPIFSTPPREIPDVAKLEQIYAGALDVSALYTDTSGQRRPWIPDDFQWARLFSDVGCPIVGRSALLSYYGAEEIMKCPASDTSWATDLNGTEVARDGGDILYAISLVDIDVTVAKWALLRGPTSFSVAGVCFARNNMLHLYWPLLRGSGKVDVDLTTKAGRARLAYGPSSPVDKGDVTEVVIHDHKVRVVAVPNAQDLTDGPGPKPLDATPMIFEATCQGI